MLGNADISLVEFKVLPYCNNTSRYELTFSVNGENLFHCSDAVEEAFLKNSIKGDILGGKAVGINSSLIYVEIKGLDTLDKIKKG